MMIDARTAYRIAYRQVRTKHDEYWRIPRYETAYYAAAVLSYRAKLLSLGHCLTVGCQTEREYYQDRCDETLGIVWAQCHACPLYHNGHPTCKPHCQILDLGYALKEQYDRTPRPYGRMLPG